MKKFENVVQLIDNMTNRQLRNDYNQADYRKVILPLTVLRRLDSVLEETKDDVLSAYDGMQEPLNEYQSEFLCSISGERFYNVSRYTFQRLLDDQEHIGMNLRNYINGFSQNALDIIRYFRFEDEIERLEEAGLLYEVISEMAGINLHPKAIGNIEMGYAFEELIRRYSENVEAGQHYTPREVIELMVKLLYIEDEDELSERGIIRTMYDPTVGTGGILSEGLEQLNQLNPNGKLELYGQEINPETYAICMADMLLKGLDPRNIKFGNTLSNDGLSGKHFDYVIANPPYGDNWSKAKKAVEDEAKLGFEGRFGAGVPKVTDGSLLFLQHMIDKMKPDGGRLGIVLSGSPLFTGGAGSGESNIRKWMIENDYVEAIVGLPNQIFYNTGINTYIWILTNKKPEQRQGKIQLIDATNEYAKMRKSLGEKRNYITSEHIGEITGMHQGLIQNGRSKVFDNQDFGYYRVTVERPLKENYTVTEERLQRLKEQKAFNKLEEEKQNEIIAGLQSMDGETIYHNRDTFIEALNNAVSGIKVTAALQKAILTALAERDEEADPVIDKKGIVQPDPNLRDYENVPMKDSMIEDIEAHMQNEVLPHVPDAWYDPDSIKIGYDIPFTRHFYTYEALRPADDIADEIRELERDIVDMMGGLFDETIRNV
ncbi:N-6 DNA methylase [Pontibacillus yanchengensis]|uniref:site-specific DNA-methyltransferase (adenine-specific) n=1 Tax=Pontibacillus yanchengensis TaxID=462910 RepID=A0A6I5A5H1_9BACI|nr:class I SAM-dependent DNA methyltransferase [Pontibacillus yanchengensis]MYL35567.1 N-6 DNA methylase [Pontibacillus yanchengensis]